MRFEILEIPGQGAQATVCVARRQGPGDIVCLKVVQAEFDSESDVAKRVRDEARLLERLDHPNIVALERRLEIDGRQVLVMEWVKGDQLHRLVRKCGAFPIPVALEIGRCVATAAEYAYMLPESDGASLRLVHRDLNLTNILMSVTGEIKVLDFGMARAQFEDRESDTMITLRGTAGYTAPEGLGTHDGKLDVYSLGICLIYLFTGHLPVFSRQKLSHDVRLSEVMTWLKENRADTPVDLDRVCSLLLDMCAYIAEERISMSEAAERLAALVPADVDLADFAEREVRPLHESRAKVPVAEHPAYQDLAFLEERSNGNVSDGDRRLSKLLRETRWYDRESEVKWMLVRSSDWTGRPLLDYVERTHRPWWQLWMQKPPKAGVLAALRLLSQRPTPAVHATCKRLTRHRDAEISGLAKQILNAPVSSVR